MESTSFPGHAKPRAIGAGKIVHGDALEWLPRLVREKLAVDAVIADPPYASGGRTIGERQKDPVLKYTQSKDPSARQSFEGDHLDQRTWMNWCRDWLGLCRDLLVDGGYALVFVDWRQLPSLTDAFQLSGLRWRGIVAWDKGEGSRLPYPAYFRHQCEYIVWGTKGKPTGKGPFAGCYREPIRQGDKHHLPGKPTALLEKLVAVAPEDGLVLDPFAGSFTTGVAALRRSRRFLGIERSAHYCAIGARRLKEAARSVR